MVTVSVKIDDDKNTYSPTFFSTLRSQVGQAGRRALVALRLRRPKRDTQIPDSNDKNNQSANVKKEENPETTCCGYRVVVDPSRPWHYKWLMVVSLAVLYNVIFVPGRAVFWELNNSVPAPVWWSLDYLCDAIYIIDILVRAHEGYLDQGLLVTDATKLRKNYVLSKKWRLDFLSLVPTDITYSWWSPTDCQLTVPCSVIVRVNRIVKLPRLWDWFERTETDTNYPNVFRICKVLLAILVLIHWNACLYFAISYAIGFGTDNWVYNNDGPKNSTLTRQYIYSFYWSTLTLTTIGETPVPENDAEYVFVVADFLAGVLIFATIVGNIGSMISNMNLARVDFQNRMDGVKQYMAFRKVGRELEARVIRWFAYTWEESGALDEERVLSALPDKLKAEIAIRVHLDTLKKVRIFQDCEPGLLEALVLKLRLQVFSPGDYICRKGDVGKEMYIVKRGCLQVVADDEKTVWVTLGAGSVFGEVSVLEIVGNKTGNRRTANVRSLGYSDLFCLAKDDLWNALADYPEARETLTERGCQILRKDGLLDEEVFKNSKSHETLEGSIVRLENTVQVIQTTLARLVAEFDANQTKMKHRLSRKELRVYEEGSLSVPTCRRRLSSFETRKKSASDAVTRHKTM
ncbi:hypothetical protein RN001_010128 [Aquatica leii]|uniref:Cyclic nucleotide-binding domain-containing protein n=1 Tax=Aquatica leii TaxID=1421715 RepID=A0AAN7SE97_9COLE|nr:hypothetical protein RN001_010128 [Aquatica leii]